MAKHWVGQRVKKVRGDKNVGLEGVVAGFDNSEPPHDMMVTILQPCRAYRDTPFGAKLWENAPSGTTLLVISKDWEPVVPPDMESIEEANELLLTDEVIT